MSYTSGFPGAAGTATRRRLPSFRGAGPVLPAVVFVLLGMVAPLALMLRTSFDRFDPQVLIVSAFTAENYIRFVSDPFFRDVLGRTVAISAVATAICLVLGLPVAYFLARFPSAEAKSRLLLLILVPLLIGNAVRTSAWMLILNDHGVLAALLRGVGITGALGLMYSATGVTIALVSVLLPFMIITLNSVFEGIERSLEDAAESLGAGHLTVMSRVVLPLALPGILAGCVLCFTLSMNAYATPVLIGGPKFHMMAPTVYQQITEAMNWPFGAALAFVLMGMTLLLTLGLSVAVQRRYRRWTA
ncbi:ABC transporter permease [Paenirhodobacter populi]|uniref:ABC transporter permease n=1 Tax=Paenirhodobacter populi TaxID=2306993 RepID=A0A443J771_9RHOB|nr:ABC transporter permease [Sinirhodobacter populi]RWR16253.1 ABC transporter permease [Sinirhodobacter populi]